MFIVSPSVYNQYIVAARMWHHTCNLSASSTSGMLQQTSWRRFTAATAYKLALRCMSHEWCMAEPGELSGLEEDVNLWFVFVYRAGSLASATLG